MLVGHEIQNNPMTVLAYFDLFAMMTSVIYLYFLYEFCDGQATDTFY